MAPPSQCGRGVDDLPGGGRMNALALDYLIALYRRHTGPAAERMVGKLEGQRQRRYGRQATKQERDALGRFMARRHGWARGHG